MGDIVFLLEDLQKRLPDVCFGRDARCVREVCLTRHDDGSWRALAGGHSHVHIGEWGGDYSGEGDTAEQAIAACLEEMSAALKEPK